MTDAKKLEYVKYVIEHNDQNKVFPVTAKSNHGISLSIWQDACKELNLNFEVRPYEHCMASAEHVATETGQGIFLREKI